MKATSLRSKQRESAKRWKVRQQGAALVRRRWERNRNRCEGCGTVVDLVEVAHLAGKGRSAKVSEAWASSEHLMAALCCARSYGLTRLGCHEFVDRGLDWDLRETLQWQAVARLESSRPDLIVPRQQGDWPLDVVRRMVALDEVGFP